MKQLVLATHNSGKVAEIIKWQQESASKLSKKIQTLQVIPHTKFSVTEPEENGLSFVENALIKARHSCRHTNKPTLADDSGLVIPVLGGQPGIYSARYGGEKNNFDKSMQLVLDKLRGYENSQRNAYFFCTMVFLRQWDDQHPIICSGSLAGKIHHKLEGDKGFGYDPIFWLNERNCTLAQLEQNDKNLISHRAIALQKLFANHDFLAFWQDY